jgi:hypothetical protein
MHRTLLKNKAARLLEVIAPAGFEAYFAELAEAGDPGRRQELAAIVTSLHS